MHILGLLSLNLDKSGINNIQLSPKIEPNKISIILKNQNEWITSNDAKFLQKIIQPIIPSKFSP